MRINLKKLIGAAAIAGAMGLPAIGVGAGAANAATPAPTVVGQAETVQTAAGPAQVQPVDWRGGHGWGGRDDWRWGDRGRGHGGWGHGGWGHGGWGHGGWGWRW